MPAKKRSAKPILKKPVRRRKKKKQQISFSPFISSLWKLIIWTIIIILAILGVLYLSECKPSQLVSFPSGLDKPKAEGAISATPEPEKTAAAKPDASLTLSFPVNAELPSLIVNRREEVIRYEGYTVSYNVDYKLANWVAWELTAEEALSKKEERTNKFSPDPTLKGKTAMNEDFSGSGFDRGHLAPAGDMKWSNKAMQQSFYFSNIVPQNSKMNGGVWNTLEQQSRQWAVTYGEVLIATGPVLETEMRRLGKNRVAVPAQMYKVICTISDNEYKAVGFLLDNKDYRDTTLKELAIPVDSVEKVTGIRFFSSLPVDAAKKMKARVDYSYWFK